MLKKQYRIGSKVKTTTHSSFPFPLFVVKLGKNSLPHNRYRFVVSKKIDKRAVIRNEVKRELSGVVEKVNDTLKQGYDMIIVTKKPIVENKDQIAKELGSFFEKAHLLK